MSAYKNISSQDYSIIPFNANKQYNFTSASSSPNQITYFSSSWTSESVDLYSSGNIKYSQIDHLFYRNYKTDIGNKFGNINYLKQKRVLYNEANILSIPAGLYGHYVKPNSFILSSSLQTAIDDSFGNLIISGTNVDDYVTDPRSILLDIGPVKGFKKYDLNTIENYTLDGFRPNSPFYRKGKKKVNTVHAPQLFKNGTFTGIADVVPAEGNTQYGPILTYGNSGSASIENEKLVIKSHPTGGISNLGARFNHSATAGTPYQMSFFTEGDTGSIYIYQTNYGDSLVSATPSPNKTTTINYIAPVDGNVSIFFRANKNRGEGGTSSYDNITIKERGIDGYSTLFKDYDDSYFLNNINYKKILFSSSSLYTSDGHFPLLDFNGVNSEIKINHNPKFNFDSEDEFSIEFWVNVKNLDLSDEVHLIGKSTTKTIIPSPLEGTSGTYPLNATGSFQSKDVNAEPQYPFEVYIKNKDNTPNIYFRKSDGNTISEAFKSIKTGSFQHIVCRLQNSRLGIGISGSILSTDINIDNGYGNDFTTNSTSNNANLYIGNKGGKSNYFSGSLSQIKIFNRALTTLQTTNHYKSSNGSPYIGNIFYPNGLAVITHPDYRLFLNPTRQGGIGSIIINPQASQVNSRFMVGGAQAISHPFGLDFLQFQGSHLIYEYEYQCTIDEHEFNHTLNTSVRKNYSGIKDFATSSAFKPYITTVGLYNENDELLVVGKLGQPLRTSNETDTTIVLRWDT